MRDTLLYAIALSICLLGPVMYAQGTQPVVYSPGNGVVTPKVLKSIPPTYTPEARAARIQGTVTVEVVVLPDGKIGDATCGQVGVVAVSREGLEGQRNRRAPYAG